MSRGCLRSLRAQQRRAARDVDHAPASAPAGLRWTSPQADRLRIVQSSPCHGSPRRFVAALASQPNSHAGISVRDDLDSLLEVLPADLVHCLRDHAHRDDLVEIVLDLGRRPHARFQNRRNELLADREVTRDDLAAAASKLGEFGHDNRAGIEGTLHRISAIRNRKGDVIGLTCRVGRTVKGNVEMIRGLLDSPCSLLFLGRPGIGKTTVIRELARTLSDDLDKRVVIVDTSNEIGGNGDVAHPAIGSARRMHVPNAKEQDKVMIEAVENHMPEVVIVDEIGTEAEAMACRSIAERGVQLIATAHGQVLGNLVKNPTLRDLVGGIESVTLGDDEARARKSQKSILERRAPPTFEILLEMRERSLWVQHDVESSVDALLRNEMPYVVVRNRDAETNKIHERNMLYTETDMAWMVEGKQSSESSSSQDDMLISVGAVASSHAASYSNGATETGSLREQLGAALDDSQYTVFNEAQDGPIQNGVPAAWLDRVQELDDVGVLTALSEGRPDRFPTMSGLKRRHARRVDRKANAAANKGSRRQRK